VDNNQATRPASNSGAKSSWYRVRAAAPMGQVQLVEVRMTAHVQRLERVSY